MREKGEGLTVCEEVVAVEDVVEIAHVFADSQDAAGLHLPVVDQAIDLPYKSRVSARWLACVALSLYETEQQPTSGNEILPGIFCSPSLKVHSVCPLSFLKSATCRRKKWRLTTAHQAANYGKTTGMFGIT